jgi:hypothetical protein
MWDVRFGLKGEEESRHKETKVEAEGVIGISGFVGKGAVSCEERTGKYIFSIAEGCEAISSPILNNGEHVYPD